MATEIERKFLVRDESWRPGASGTQYRQGYLSSEGGRTVRVRTAGEHGYLTIKGPRVGLGRSEFEYLIPVADANQILDELCPRPLIEKIRYRIEYQGLVWEVDEFRGENEGLVLAEVELEHEAQPVALPPWVGEEVSEDPRYYNSNLAKRPYTRW